MYLHSYLHTIFMHILFCAMKYAIYFFNVFTYGCLHHSRTKRTFSKFDMQENL